MRHSKVTCSPIMVCRSYILFSTWYSANPNTQFYFDVFVHASVWCYDPLAWVSRCGLGKPPSLISPVLSIDAVAIVLELTSLLDRSSIHVEGIQCGWVKLKLVFSCPFLYLHVPIQIFFYILSCKPFMDFLNTADWKKFAFWVFGEANYRHFAHFKFALTYI